MKILKISLTALIIILVQVMVTTHTFAAGQPKPDVRLLIDISGSMKQNDPQNLRVPALQLVTNLMPKGADAGVWAFGRYVNMMVPLSQVDGKWQETATATANKINSAGLYTNIGGVLEKASYGWSRPNPQEKRSIILLTDGMVDISKDPTVNQKERTRILEQVLPKLKQAGVAIHTIALSQNADHELLQALSNQTDGWYQAVDNANDLQKVFLKIFEQSAARDALPLSDNKFNVDASIDEMTLLVFKRKPEDNTRLILPDQSVIEEARADGSVRWFETEGYDLITVQAPAGGEWRIDADVDPDNRVMIVSKLGLDVAPVPNNLLAGEAIDYSVSLLEDGKTITKQDFLSLVKAQLIQSKAGSKNRLSMFYDSGSHEFKQNFFTDSGEGVLNLTLELKSPTFERTRMHAVNIYGSPLTHELSLSEDGLMPHQLAFTVRDEIVKPETLVVNLTMSLPNGETKYLAIEDMAQPLDIPAFEAGGEYQVSLEIKGESVLGRQFSLSPAPIEFSSLPGADYLARQQAEQEAAQQQQASEETQQETAEQNQEPEQEEESRQEAPPPEPIEPEAEETDWQSWLYIGLGANLLLIVLGFLGWKFIQKKKAQSSAKLVEELGIDSEDDDDDFEDAGEAAPAGGGQ